MFSGLRFSDNKYVVGEVSLGWLALWRRQLTMFVN
jgi:hypothetical protein